MNTGPESLLAQVRTEDLIPWARRHRDFQRFLARRVPTFAVPERAEEWEAHAEALRRRVLGEVVFAGVPAEIVQVRPRVEWGETLRPGPGYVIRKLRYEGYPGMWVPALLYQPDPLPERVPAILNVNGHVGPPGKSQDYEQLRCITLAKRGLLALHPEWLGCGELETPENEHGNLTYLDLCGQAGLAVFYLHLTRALDVLLDLPQADPSRVAVTGLSGGGWQTLLLGALDTRVTAIIPNAGYIGELWRIFCAEDVGDSEQQPTDLVAVADYVHLTALLAPRPALLIYNSYDDCCFMAHRAWHSVYQPVKPLYDRLEAGDRFIFHENADPGTHNYDEDNRRALYGFLNRHFQDSEATIEEDPADQELLSKEALLVGVPEGNATLASLAREASRALPQRRLRADTDRVTWSRAARPVLREVVRYAPLQVTDATRVEEQAWGERRRRTWEVRLGSEWTLGVVEYVPAEEEAQVVVFVADGGRAASAERVAELWAAGLRVFAVDLHLAGELIPRGQPAWLCANMVATVGERPLGVQAAQLHAVAAWAEAGVVHAQGATMSVAAVIAAALEEQPRAGLVLYGLPATLKLLLDMDRGYGEHPTLYCFGLLREFDVRELLALCAGREITCHGVGGDPERVEAELGDLAGVLIRGG